MKNRKAWCLPAIWRGKRIIERIEVATTQQVNVKISVAQVNRIVWAKPLVLIEHRWLKRGEFVFDQFDAANLSTLITALGNDQIAEVLAEPNLTVLSGESASFLVGGEVPVIVSTSSNVNISFKEFGIKLDLTAKVLSQDKIRMHQHRSEWGWGLCRSRRIGAPHHSRTPWQPWSYWWR